jgi:hypothetical protein
MMIPSHAAFAYFWPCFAIGLVCALIGGVIAFRKKDRARLAWRVAALVLGIVGAAIWHGPLGAGDRLAKNIEINAHATLAYYELPAIKAHVHRAPLTRRVVLEGQPTEFQRYELPRTMETLPGVSSSRWAPTGGGIPLIVEAAAAAVLGFLFGLLLAYLVELHRRHNAQWNW